jgi:branched-chain amino acid transport system ATP-binding protein
MNDGANVHAEKGSGPGSGTGGRNGAGAMLEVHDLSVRYGVITALRGVSFRIAAGDIVTLIGSNGAGKTTCLRAISGLLTPSGGRVTFEGNDLTGCKPHELVKRGMAHVPEGRMVFANLTVRENLDMGAYLQRDKAVIRQSLEFVFATFPRLLEREKQLAGTLSGGEQQMLAIGRALMSRPRFLMLDEPSLGIAPLLVKTIFEKIVEINRTQGITVLLVEQNANLALEVSRYGYVIETGRIILENDSAKLRQDPQVKAAYLGG